ncbi:MAG TPA: SDR family NAD(P)-dependent oxidoreductase, partial [Kofleriaceae bacterium]|nr:SDR family NAD(P)-dependent oxidoreductase [Kofleriaceae bacterium]
DITTADYWVRHVREAVRFGDSVGALHARGVDSYLEIGPRPTLVGLVPACLPAGAAEPALIASLRPELADEVAALNALGRCHTQGRAIAWSAVFPDGGRRVALPTYPWQRERYWIDATPQRVHEPSLGHPLLGARVTAAGVDAVYEAALSLATQPWLADHRLGERVIVPGTAIAELVRAAAEHHLEDTPEVTRLVLQAPIAFEAGSPRRVQVVLTEAGTRAQVYSQPVDAPGPAWTLHASAEIAPCHAGAAAVDVAALRARCATPVDVAAVYEDFAAAGFGYGPMFRGIQALAVGAREALGDLRLPDDADTRGYGGHPALLDAALQVVKVVAPATRAVAWVPFELGRFVIHEPGHREAVVHVRITDSESAAGSVDPARDLTVDITVVDRGGAPIAELSALRFRPATALAGQAAAHAARDQLVRQLVWQLQWSPAAAASPSLLSGRWLVVSEASDDEATAALVAALRAAQVSHACVTADAVADALPADHIVCAWSAASPRRAAAPAGGLAHDGERARQIATAALAVVDRVASQAQPPRLWWLTAGAVAVGEHASRCPAAAAAWGLGRTVWHERPELRCTLIDLESFDHAADAIARELAASDDEPQIAWRAGRRHVARLVRAARLEGEAVPVRAEGAVLVAGGLGGLGLTVARWLAVRGVPQLVLTGRRGLDTPGARDAVAALEALGARVTVAAVDVADPAAVDAAIAAIAAHHRLRGVVHAAGVLDDGVLGEQTPARIARVMAPKAHGAWNLHRATERLELDFFVMFSSLTGTLGAAGQGPYAAANAYLDALASWRVAAGLPAQSLAWGPWSEVGMAASLDTAHRARVASQGVIALSPARGLGLLEHAMARPEAQLVVAGLDLRAVARALGGAVPAVWRSLVRAPRPGAPSAIPAAPSLAAADPARREQMIRDAVREEIARALSVSDAGALAFDRRLSDAGLDSLMAIELRNALSKRLQLTLPATLAFEHPTPEALVRHLLAVIARAPSAPVAPAPVAAPAGDEHRLVPLSAGQQRLWFLDRLAPGLPLYNLHVGWQIRG